MIIKTHPSITRQKTYSSLIKKGLILVFAGLSVYLFVLFCFNIFSQPEVKDLNYTLLADAEEIDGDYFVNPDFQVKHGGCQSSEYSHSGKYSVKLGNKSRNYGFSIHLDVMKGDEIYVKVWAYSPDKEIGRLVLKDEEKGGLYVQSEEFSFSDGWQLLTISAKIENPLKDNKLSVYCFNLNDSPVYFDDLTFVKNPDPELVNTSDWDPENIHLYVNDGAFMHLKKKRHEAIQKGLLINSEDSWVKGAIYPESDNQEKVKVSLRLKGDWTDHLQGNKWSFRVETETQKSWKRLKTFSLQNPATRSYLFEWLLHEFFIFEDVLTTRYEFVNFKLNEKDLGLYVYEEHFLKQLPEFNKKKEGPIIRFVESGFWDAMLRKSQLNADHDGVLIVGSPEIKPFSEKKTFKDSLLNQQFVIAQNLLYEFQYGLKQAEDIFEIDLFAKYYAIMDLTGGYHGVAWHNQRFYYNPVIGKLEPVGFDGYGGEELKHVPAKAFYGVNQSSLSGYIEMDRKLFRDKSFLEKYHFYLEKLSDSKHIDAFLGSVKKKIHERLIYIRKSKKDYNYSPDYIYQRAANIRNALYPNSASLQTKTVKPGLIAICNRHQIPVEIVGSMTKSGGVITYLDSTELFFTTKFADLPDYSHQLSVPESAEFLVYRVPGLAKNYYTEINKWPIPQAFAPVQELKGNLVQNHPAYIYHPERRKIIFNTNAVVKEPLVIPANYSVLVRPGSKIDIVNKAFILSYSPVHFLGLEDEPVLVTSSDKSARSLTVIKADAKSRIDYTTFSNLGAFSFKGWNLPGGVNFYESDVDIYHSAFTGNSCEDALNIVRSRFDFKNNSISNTFADGFDADFCTGQVTDCYFLNTGNDAMDFSTSKINIKNCKIKNAGDKGISIGEQGKSIISNTIINGANIGIASKDLSQTTVKDAKLMNCNIGFSAYQKKPEYGQASIFVEKYSEEKVKKLYHIFPGSYLKLVNLEINGD